VKVYRIRITAERAPDVSCAFELSARHALDDVHGAIQAAFGWDDDHPHVFYMSGKKHERCCWA
jgi:hypothetical protein